MYTDNTGYLVTELVIGLGISLGVTTFIAVAFISIVAFVYYYEDIKNTLIITGLNVIATGVAKITNTFDRLYSHLNANIYNAKKSKKERATDKPSYVDKSQIDKNLTAQLNAKNIMNSKFGSGKWPKGPGSDYNKIVKWITRSGLLKGISYVIDKSNPNIVFDFSQQRRD